MLNDFAKAWVAALRSGSYLQGKKALRTAETYCCLGVACDVAKRTGQSTWDWTASPCELEKFNFRSSDDSKFPGSNAAYLPSEIADLLGLRTTTGEFEITEDLMARFPALPANRNRPFLTDLNDQFNWTLAQIADLIEAEPPILFKADAVAV